MWRFLKRKPATAAPPPPVHIYEVVYIYPKVGATADDLVALGRALHDWLASNDQSVTEIVGLDKLLAGEFPPMEVYIGCINPRTIAAPRWEKCPAILMSPDEKVSNERVMESLKEALPPELYRSIHWPPFD